jgi:dipeptidyl aminopeptidase/acylaminoacyl peptidase
MQSAVDLRGQLEDILESHTSGHRRPRTRQAFLPLVSRAAVLSVAIPLLVAGMAWGWINRPAPSDGSDRRITRFTLDLPKGHRTLVWVDQSGKAETLPLPPASYLYPRLSPDGRFLAVEIEGPNHDIYLYDFARSVLTKITTDGLSHDPVWTPDGKSLVFRSSQAGGMTMWTMPADRSAPATRPDPTGNRQSPVSVSPDGRFLTFDQKDPESNDDAWILPLGGHEAALPVARSRFSEGGAKLSPDGKWIAYSSDESGRPQIYIQPFPGPVPKVQVSSEGGIDPRWRATGGELYYRRFGQMMAVAVTTSPTLKLSAPRPLWVEAKYTSGSGSSCGMPGVTASN